MTVAQNTLEPVDSGLVILIDTAEQHPFEFKGLFADANQGKRPLVVRRKFVNLGRHPHSLGDYSVEGYAQRVHIERKSVQDLHGTVLGWERIDGEGEVIDLGRRKRFEKELENLAKIEYGMVVVEGTYNDCLAMMPEYGKKTVHDNRKIFNRSIQAFMMDYKGCAWHFAGSREIAEAWTFQTLRRFVRKDNERKRQAAKQRS